MCWLTLDGPRTIWAFIGPVIFILAVNLYFFLRIMNIILRIRVDTEQSDPGKFSAARAIAMRGLKASVSFFSVMGVGWTFGILVMVGGAPDVTASLVFQYLFAIFAGLQGVFILVFHCLRDPHLKSHMSHRREKRRRQKEASKASSAFAKRSDGTVYDKYRTGELPSYESTSNAPGTASTGEFVRLCAAFPRSLKARLHLCVPCDVWTPPTSAPARSPPQFPITIATHASSPLFVLTRRFPRSQHRIQANVLGSLGESGGAC